MSKYKSGLIFTILLSFSIFLFNGCSKFAPNSPVETEQSPEALLGSLTDIKLLNNNFYPQEGSVTLNYIPLLDIFSGGKIHLPNGSSFHIEKGSLIPPLSLSGLLKIVIDMKVDRFVKEKMYIYTFGPSGSQFNPPAKAWFSFSDMPKAGTPKVFYIHPDGHFEEIEILEFDKLNKRVLVEIKHFSRYALALS